MRRPTLAAAAALLLALAPFGADPSHGDDGDPARAAAVASRTAALRGLEALRGLGSAAALDSDVRVLFVFVNDQGRPEGWTPDRRATVERHVASACRWLEKEAERYGAKARLTHAFLPATSGRKVSLTVDEQDRCGGPHHSTWANQAAAALAGRSGSLASLFGDLFRRAKLPLEPGVRSLVLFGVRRYCPSIAFPYAKGQHPEFEKERAIIYDEGGPAQGQRFLDSQIAHETLHLFSAIDLAREKIPAVAAALRDTIVARTGDDDVMRVPTQKPIDRYRVGDLTAWLVGWRAAPPSWLLDDENRGR